MGDPSGPIEENGGQNGDMEEGPSSLIGVGPPSPLTGCYLLIILGEPHSDEHKDIILQRLVKGFLSWDALQTHVDLEEELNTITVHAPEGEDARHGERLIQYASENLVTEILIHPQYNTLIQCMRNLLSSFTRHRHIIHAGYSFSGNGSWILQDGTFSVSDFAEAFQEHEVQRVLRAYPETVSMDIHCDSSTGLWSALPDKNYAKTCKIRINPVDVLDSGSDKIKAFIDYLAPMLNPANLNDLLESSDVVGNIRFSHPTLYVFPGGQGDAALFGINGFNMLVDGGFNRKACFWNFARHLDRLDAVLMTRINNSNIQGMSSVIERKCSTHVYPQIGHFFCNIPERRAISSPEENKDKDSLVIDLFDKGQKMISNLKSISLKPQTCYRDIEPMNLYHKVGHGTLDMYVISPGKDSREVKEFIQKWTTNDQKLFAAKDSKDFQFPIQNLVSICALLVWQPANPEDTITRILFPGSTPDYKIMEGLEKIKHLEFMKYPMCTAKKLVPSISTATLTKKVLKSTIIEKSIPEPILPSKTIKTEKDNQAIDNKVKSIQDNKTKESKLIEEQTGDKKVPLKSKPKKIVPKKSDSMDEKQKDEVIENKDKDEESVDKPDVVINGNDINETDKKDETDVKPKPKKFDQKSKVDTKTTIKSRIDSKPPKSMDKKQIKRDASDKKEIGKSSPTTTPKKTSTDPKLQNGVVKEKEIKPKITSRVTKSSPSSTPAKSTKEANNRKVLESKQKAKTVKRETVKTIDKKEEKIERKPISHRTKGISPSRRPPDSPKKSIKPKTEKDNIIRKAKLDKGGTTDSSLVSTPSADDTLINKKIVDVVSVDEAVQQRELDDLKEEQEAVREIEEVFKREEKSKKNELSSDHREVAKQDSATEAEDDEEYLIIEKEEVEQYTEDSINEQESSMTKEEEMQKHQRDSQESEKKRKSSLQTTEEVVEPSDIIEPEEAVEVEVTHVEIIEPEKGENDVQPDSIEEEAADGKIDSSEKEQIKEEVQEIISSAKEMIKIKSDSNEEAAKTEEISSLTPEDKLSITKKTSDTKDELEPIQAGKDGEAQNLPESQPFSTTIESGATTAPTLPEDERIPLDEIKEDLVVEEKYIKEETKETKEPEILASSVLQKTYEPLERTVPSKMNFDTTQPHLRDIVKTPDEVADLPVHEEADIETYEGSEEARDDKKSTERKTVDDDVKHQPDARDSTVLKNDAKNDSIPNGSVINKEDKEENEEHKEASDDEDHKEKHIKEDKEEDQAAEEFEDKHVCEKMLDKKVDVTGFKEKVSTTAEKVEYAVEDLGKNFENTLKDVTNKEADKILGERIKEDTKKDDDEFVQQKEDVKETLEPIDKSKDLTEKVDEEEVEDIKGKDAESSTVASTTDKAQEINQELRESKPDRTPELPETDDLKGLVDKAFSFVGSISKSMADNVESLVESCQLVDEPKVESIEITDADQKLEFKEVFDYSHPYELKSFPTELRETHITTLDSPVADKGKEKIIDLKILDKLPEDKDDEDDLSGKSMVASFHPDDFKYSSFEDSNLNDIKEEEEEDRFSPPNNPLASRKESTEISDLTSKDTITVISPPRAVSPREEEVLKIVANVAEVLKSEKDIAEIIPDFSEEELERKLRGASPRFDDENGTVQRMLVTASSEDGGEEIEICPEGTIKFSPASTTPEILSGKVTPEVTKEVFEIKSDDAGMKVDVEQIDLFEKSDEKEEKETSAPSTPEAKTSSVSIDEKEKHELPEKMQLQDVKLIGNQCEATQDKSDIETDSVSRKESVVSDYIDDIIDRRESSFSAFSEKDFTKDESSMDDSRPASAVSHDFKIDKDDVTIRTLIVDESDDAARSKSAQSAVSDQSPEGKSVISKDDKKSKEEEKSPISSDLKVEVSDERRESGCSHISDKSGVETSRPDSIISHFSDKSEPELKEKLGSSPDSIASFDKSMANIKFTDHNLLSNLQDVDIGPQPIDKKPNEEETIENTNNSRPESATSHTSETDKTEEFDTLRACSVISQKTESVEETSKKSVIQVTQSEVNYISHEGTEEKQEQKLTSSSAASNISGTEDKHHDSRPPSVTSSKDEKDAMRSDSITSDKVDEKQQKDSRAPSVASHVSDLGESKDQHDSRPVTSEKLDEKQQKDSRPPSVASHISDLGETKDQHDSRPSSLLSSKDEKDTVRPDSVTSEKQKDSRPPSVASHISDLGETKDQPDSRPASIISLKDEKDAVRPDSATSDKLDEKQKDSRSPSVASHVSDLGETKDQHDSLPASVTSSKDEKDAVEIVDETQKDSRPPSVASHVSDLAETKDLHDSRPASVLTSKDENDAVRPDSVTSGKIDEKQKDSRAPSVASHVSDLEVTKDQQDSRPASVIGSKDEKDAARPDSVTSEKVHEKDSRAPSVASHVSDLGQTKDQHDSCPASVISSKDGKNTILPDSVTSEKQKDSRPPSVASHVSDLEDTKDQDDSRSVISSKEEKDEILPDSITSFQVDEKQQKDSHSPSVASHVSDLGETKDQQDSRPASVISSKDEKDAVRRDSVTSDKVDDKQQKDSRAPSVASHVSDLGETKDQDDSRSVISSKNEKDEIRPDSITSFQVDEKQQKDSHSPSVASHASDLGDTKDQHDSRPASVISSEEEKDGIRPDSVTSEKVDEKQKDSRAPSVASHVSELGETKDQHDSRPASVISSKGEKDAVRPDSVTSEKVDEKQQKDSRAPSVASHVSDLGETKDQHDSRPISVISSKDEKDTIRPDSVTSDKEDEKQQKDSRAPSVASHVSDLGQTEDQHDSRPASVISSKDEKNTIRPDSVTSEKQKDSRPPSVASHVSDLEDTKNQDDSHSVISSKDEKDDIRPDSATSDKVDDKQQKDSRAPSVASHVSDLGETKFQDDSRSIVSSKDEKDEIRLDPVTSVKVDEKQQKDSRSPSVASHVSDLGETKDQHDSRPASVISSKDEKDAARPDSVTSDKVDEKEQKDSRAPSVSSHVSDLGQTKDQHDSRPASVISSKDEKNTIRSDSLMSENKKDSRPPSVASHASDLGDTKDQHDSRPASVISSEDEKDGIRPDSVTSEKIDEKQKDSRAPSVASHVSDLGETKDQHDSRPASVISSKDEKDAVRPDSVTSDKVDDKQQKDSRAPSVASHVSDLGETKDQNDSRPASVISSKDEKDTIRPDSVTSEKVDEKQQKDSRAPSVASHVSDLGEAKDQHDSRPASVISSKDEKDAVRPDSVTSDKVDEKQQKDSRAPSVASHVSDLGETKDQNDSRPASVISSKDENDTIRPDSVTSEKVDEKQQKDSRAPSVASHVSSLGETKDQHDSRPASVISSKDEKDAARPDSVTSDKIDEKQQKDSRAPSVASHVSDLGQTEDQHDSRPASVISSKDEKNTIRTDSVTSEKQKDSRPPSVASHVSNLEDTKDQDDSRSVISSKDEKDEILPDSITSVNVDEKQKKDSRASSGASHVSDLGETEDQNDSRPASVINSKDEKDVRRPDSVTSDKLDQKQQKDSRAPSVASHVSDLGETKDQQDSRPASVISSKDEKDAVRRDSVASDKIDDKQKNDSRSPSVASHVSELGETKDQDDSRSVISSKDEIRPDSITSFKVDEKQQIDSHSPSAASHASDLGDMKDQHDSRPASVISSEDEKDGIRTDSVTSEKQKDSRPPSVASHVSNLDDTKDQDDSRSVISSKDEKDEILPDSITSVKVDEKQQKDSRASSGASHVSDLGETEDQNDSRPASVISSKDEKDVRRHDSVTSDKLDQKQQKDSRAPSVASHVSDLGETKDQHDSRPASVISSKDEKDAVRPDSVTSDKVDERQQEDARPPSVASHVSNLGETKDQNDSRPASVISSKDEEDTIRPDSVTSEKVDEKQQKDSRAPSVASHVSDLGETKDQHDSRPASVISSKDEKDAARPDSVTSDKVDEKQPKDSRAPSVAGHISDLGEMKDQNDSRPASVISSKDEKDTIRPDSVTSEKVDEKQQKDSRSHSLASHVSDLDESKDQHDSRPASVISSKDEKEAVRPDSVTSDKVDEKQQKDSRAPSAASHDSDLVQAKDQHDSRPASVISSKDDRDTIRPDSVTSEKQKDSRPPSVASHVSDLGETKDRRDSGSVISSKDEKDTIRPDSATSNKVDEKQQKDSRSPSVASFVSDLGETKVQHDSRPSSVLSSQSEKGQTRPDTNEKLDEKHKDSRPPSGVSHLSDDGNIPLDMSCPLSATSYDNQTSNVSETLDKTLTESADKKLNEECSQQKGQQCQSRPPSVASHKSDDVCQHVSRPASVASNVSENEHAKKPTDQDISAARKSESRPMSSQSHVSDQSTNNIDTTDKVTDSRFASVVSSHDNDMQTSRPGSVSSFVSEKDLNQRPGSAANQISESKIQSRRESAVELCSADDDDDDVMDIVKAKDSRSKSVSSIMMTSMYKPDGFEPMSTFDEGFEQSKDDISVTGGSRKTSDLSGLIEDIKKIDEKLMSSDVEDKFDSTTSITPENEVSDKISTETIQSGRSSPLESKIQDKSNSMASTSLEAPKTSADSLSGKSTPDVADIENKILSETTIKTSLNQLNTKPANETSKQQEVTTEDHDHISKTEKLSKTVEVKSQITSEIKSTIKSSSSELHTKSSSSSSDLQSVLKETATNKDVTSIKSEFRSYTPSSDDFDLHEANSPRSDISTGHVARVICGWTGSDDETTNSPLSTTSQAPCSPPSKFTYETEYELQRSSSGVSKKSEFDIDDSQDDMPPEYGSEEVAAAIPIHTVYKSDPMSTSFYGKLPESEPIPITTSVRTVITKQYDEYTSSGPDSSSCVSQDSKSSSDHRFLDEADLDFEKALEEHRQVRGSDVMSSVTSKYEFSPSKQAIESAKVPEFPLGDIQKGKSIESKPEQSSTSQVQTKSDEQIKKEQVEERVSSWGAPLGLPSPVPVESQTTPKRERKLMINKTKMNNEKNLRKRSESPIKGKKVTPIYMDLTYVPHTGNSYYSHVEFFKRVRARYYVFSGTEPSRDVYNALLEAKQTWEDKELEVTIIPTYDTDVLGYWVSENEDLLAKYHIDLSPSASRCTINLQDHETSCSAYRLEF